MLKRRVNTHDDISEFLAEEKEIFFNAIIESIELGWENNIDRVMVAEFAITKTDSIYEIAIEQPDWEESLYLALYYFEGVEDYEKCSKLQKLIADIYND